MKTHYSEDSLVGNKSDVTCAHHLANHALSTSFAKDLQNCSQLTGNQLTPVCAQLEKKKGFLAHRHVFKPSPTIFFSPCFANI